MAYEFKLPDLGEGLTEGEIGRWLVHEGQEIAEDAPLVEIATDKTTVEIPSPAAGLVSKILVQEGDVVPVGTVIVVIGGDGSAPAEPTAAPPAPAQAARDTSSQASTEKVRATPLVRRLAEELGGSLETLRDWGAEGRVAEPAGRRASEKSSQASGRREPIRGIRRQM